MAFVLVYKPLDWQLRGLSQTRTGYGSKLTSSYCVVEYGELRLRRIYVTCYGNAGTAWFNYRGKRRIVPDATQPGEIFLSGRNFE